MFLQPMHGSRPSIGRPLNRLPFRSTRIPVSAPAAAAYESGSLPRSTGAPNSSGDFDSRRACTRGYLHTVAWALCAEPQWRTGTCFESSVLLYEVLRANGIEAELRKGLCQTLSPLHVPTTNWHVWVNVDGMDLDLGSLLLWHKFPTRNQAPPLALGRPPSWPLPLHEQPLPASMIWITTEVASNECRWRELVQEQGSGKAVVAEERLQRFWSVIDPDYQRIRLKVLHSMRPQAGSVPPTPSSQAPAPSGPSGQAKSSALFSTAGTDSRSPRGKSKAKPKKGSRKKL